MLDAKSAIGKMQRTRGRAQVAVALKSGTTRLTQLYQSGSAKVFLPRVHGPVPEIVYLNTAGGVTGGDQLSYDLTVGAGAQAVATTQTAERAYATLDGAAEVDLTFRVGSGGRLDWLPQETILFDTSSLHRRTQIDLQGDATCLMVEMIVLGRAAMGEQMRHGRMRDLRHVTRDGVPVLMEPMTLTQPVLAQRSAAAGLAETQAFATLALIAPGAEDALGPLRRALPANAAASGWDGKCVARFMAKDAWQLKTQVAAALNTLRAGDLPRVWQV